MNIRTRIPVLLLVSLGLAACPSCAGRDSRMPAGGPESRAVALARSTILVDTHVDLPERLVGHMEDVSVRTESGDFDYPRARAGGLDAPFMSIYVPADLQAGGGAREYADQLIDMVEGLARDWPEEFSLARTPGEVRENFHRHLISLPMGMENGAPIGDDLANLEHFYRRGIRYITLTHSRDNQICDSSYDTAHTWKGLSPFGRQVIAGMNRLGIMIDVSHVSDDAFYQTMELTRAPAIASHSSCRAYTPGWERNMDDDMIRRLAAGGGVIQINFGSAFLRGDARQQSTDYWEAMRRFLEENKLEEDDPGAGEFRDRYWRERPRIFADVADVVDHIDHVVHLVGVDHVGFGSDFEGVGDSLPTGLKDVSAYPNLIQHLLDRGYSRAEIRKICGGNLLRVWSEVEAVARRLQSVP